MPVYVDDMRARVGRYVFSHMLADSDAELHAMADAIGVQRKWWQAPPRHSSHYDIVQTKRELAIAQGAIQVTIREAATMNAHRRTHGTLGTLEAARARLAARFKDAALPRKEEHPA